MWYSDPEENQNINAFRFRLLSEPLTPQFESFLEEKDVQYDPIPCHVSHSDNHYQHGSSKVHPSNSDESVDDTDKACLREEWEEEDSANFIKFLGRHMINKEHLFQDWRKPNQRGIFKRMAASLKTKNREKCRLRFNTYKRKHSTKKYKEYIPTPRMMIIQKLKQYKRRGDQESNQILLSLNLNEEDLDQQFEVVNHHHAEAEKEGQFISQLYSQMFQLTSQHPQNNQKQETTENQNNHGIKKLEELWETLFPKELKLTEVEEHDKQEQTN